MSVKRLTQQSQSVTPEMDSAQLVLAVSNVN